MNKTRILLVRHGETVWHTENRFAGSTDVELTERGRQQARALAHWASNAGITALYSSPLNRAMATAEPVSRMLGLEIACEDQLRELHFGSGEGMTHAEMSVAFPDAYHAFLADPVASPLPGGEHPREAVARARTCLERIAVTSADRSPAQRVLVVLHSTLIRLLLCALFGLNPSRYRQLFPELGNVALTELAFDIDASGRVSEIGLLRFNVPMLRPFPDPPFA